MKAFTVVTTPLFNRLLAKLSPEHPELPGILETAIGILKADPYNISAVIQSGSFTMSNQGRVNFASA